MKTVTSIFARIVARLATLAVAAALALPAPAFAEGNFYLALEGGQMTLDSLGTCANDDSTIAVRCESDAEIAWGANIGYHFNEYFAAEAGAIFASGYKTVGTVTDGANRGRTASVELDIYNLMLGGRASYPVTDGLFVFGKGGMNVWEVEASNDSGTFASPARTVYDSESGFNPYFGGGVGYVFDRVSDIEVRLGFTRFIYKDGDVDDTGDFISFSASIRSAD